MKTFVAAVLLVLLSASAGAQDFKAGLDAYDRNDFESALAIWHPLAEKGDARAQYNLGAMFFNGQGVSFDAVEAVRWYRAAAEQGYGPAQANLAFMYETGQGVPQSFVEAYKWTALAAAHRVTGAAQARVKLTEKMTPEQVDAATRAATEWRPVLAEAAPEPVPETGREADPPAGQSLPALEATPDQIRDAQRLLNTLGHNAGPPDGIAGPRTIRAVRAFQSGNGIAETGGITGVLLAQLEAVAAGEDPLATDPPAPEPEAAPEIASVPTPPVAEAGPLRAGDCDIEAAHPADARLPADVSGVTFESIDADRAIAACESAVAENDGDARFQFQLARGLHRAERFAEAVVYYQQAGLRGHRLAQKSLGFAYANGLGVSQDFAKAAEWHLLAAAQGDADAQHNLGYLFAGGRGVEQDNVQAHMWFNIAAANGRADAAAQRDALAERMSAEHISEAERRALAWYDRNPAAAAGQ